MGGAFVQAGRQGPVAKVTVRAPAKINLSLRVCGRRPDGYHLLDSVMVPISIFDVLEISVWPAVVNEIRCDVAGGPAPLGDDNLAVRAARLFLDRVPKKVCLQIDMRKEIPIGAGLGGGSSDAAAVLIALDFLLGTSVGEESLMGWGLELGADVPFFVFGRPARVTGIGERAESWGGYCPPALVVAFPGLGLDTREVYREYDASLTKSASLSNKLMFTGLRDYSSDLLVNDLEAPACRILPSLKLLKQRLLDLGATGALMTGSGSAVFGVWGDRESAGRAAKQLVDAGIWARVAHVLGEAPRIEGNTEEHLRMTDGR